MTTTKNVAIRHFGRLTGIEEDQIIAALMAKKLISVLEVSQAVEVLTMYTANMQIDERLVIKIGRAHV